MSGSVQTHRKPRMVSKSIPFHRVEWLMALLVLKREVGGSFDFKRNGQLDRFTVYTGAHMHVVLPDTFSVEWHTHPKSTYIELPSVTDLKAAMKRKLRQGDFSGELSLVICEHGICVYSFKEGFKKLTTRQWYEIESVLQKGRDSKSGLEKQMAQIRPYGFKMEIQSWEKIKQSGLRLRFCLRKYVVPH